MRLSHQETTKVVELPAKSSGRSDGAIDSMTTVRHARLQKLHCGLERVLDILLWQIDSRTLAPN